MKIGTDPEYFLMRDGMPVPAHRFFGPKEEKIEVAPGVTAFRDGYAVELNVPACHHPTQLFAYVYRGLQGIRDRVGPSSGIVTVARPTVPINLDVDMVDAPADVQHFGCEPSYCAYTGVAKRPRISAMTHPYRYAGAHMHFSASPEEQKTVRFGWLKDRQMHQLFVRLMDYYVGFPLTVSGSNEGMFMRRRYYGQAGEYRPQEYPDGSLGIEYRTPGSGQMVREYFILGLNIFANLEVYAKVPMDKKEDEVRKFIDTGEMQ